MKKFFSLVIASLMTVCAFAQDALSVQGTAGKDGGTATLDLMLETSQELATIGAYIYFPEGITPVGLTSVCSVPGSMNYIESDEDGKNYIIILFNAETKEQAIPVTTEPTCVGKITVNVSSDIENGEYDVVCKKIELTGTDGTITPADNTSSITVQSAAVIEPQDEDFVFDILPAQISSSTTTLPILMKNKLDVASFTLEVTYPTGISPKSGRGVAPTVNKSNLYSSTDPSIQALSVTQTVSGQVAKYTVTNTQTDTYMAKDEFYEILQVPVTVSSTDAICNIKVKVSDIVAYDAENDVNLVSPINIKGGEFMTTLIAGQPSAQEAILYGHYTKDAVNAFNTAMKNIAVANITATTIDNGVGNFQDVITVDDNKNWVYYFRKSENYATTVMPYELKVFTAADFPELNLEEKEPYCQLFTVESMTAESIVIKELPEGETIPANTPCIFKGVLSFLKTEEPLNLGSIKEQNLGETTFMGTYEATEIADGAGYYISSDGKFYSDGATVRPFRGYFDGTIAGVKSFSVKLDTANGLIDITDQFSAEDIYSLQGIKMNKTQKGVNIVNGKKVYVK